MADYSSSIVGLLDGEFDIDDDRWNAFLPSQDNITQARGEMH